MRRNVGKMGLFEIDIAKPRAEPLIGSSGLHGLKRSLISNQEKPGTPGRGRFDQVCEGLSTNPFRTIHHDQIPEPVGGLRVVS
jgi:hypothetical protein